LGREEADVRIFSHSRRKFVSISYSSATASTATAVSPCSSRQSRTGAAPSSATLEKCLCEDRFWRMKMCLWTEVYLSADVCSMCVYFSSHFGFSFTQRQTIKFPSDFFSKTSEARQMRRYTSRRGRAERRSRSEAKLSAVDFSKKFKNTFKIR